MKSWLKVKLGYAIIPLLFGVNTPYVYMVSFFISFFIYDIFYMFLINYSHNMLHFIYEKQSAENSWSVTLIWLFNVIQGEML